MPDGVDRGFRALTLAWLTEHGTYDVAHRKVFLWTGKYDVIGRDFAQCKADYRYRVLMLAWLKDEDLKVRHLI